MIGRPATFDMRFTSALSRVVCVGLVSTFAAQLPAQQVVPKPGPEIVISFKEGPEKNGFVRSGPNAKDLVKFEADGLRITLPSGYPKLRPATGVASDLTLTGDFELTLKFELLNEPAQGDVSDYGTRLALVAGLEAPNQSCIKFSRAVRAKSGSEFLTYSAQWNPGTGQHEKRFQPVAAKSNTGRLRLVREDAMLSFLAADGDDANFELLRSYGFSAEDLKTVRIVANTDSPKASLDVRIVELRIRPLEPANQARPAPDIPAPPQGQIGDQTQPSHRGWLLALLMIGLTAAVAFAVAIGVGLYVRKRQRREGPATKSSPKA